MAIIYEVLGNTTESDEDPGIDNVTLHSVINPETPGTEPYDSGWRREDMWDSQVPDTALQGINTVPQPPDSGDRSPYSINGNTFYPDYPEEGDPIFDLRSGTSRRNEGRTATRDPLAASVGDHPTYWFGYWFYFPDEGDKWHIGMHQGFTQNHILQLHTTGNNGFSPTFSIRLQFNGDGVTYADDETWLDPDEIDVQFQYEDGANVPYTKSMADCKGHWEEWILRYKFSFDANEGSITLYVNGVEVWATTGTEQTFFDDAESPANTEPGYPKWGGYGQPARHFHKFRIGDVNSSLSEMQFIPPDPWLPPPKPPPLFGAAQVVVQ